ncbi:hypothetical protein GFM11_10225 [Rhizobium leguminosarum bv. viciae]|uniref:hypothetical protein n=1 Tax=Rhizobium leguminosarum TaxID=384 RepID=UPI001440F4DB|nr:hypothetical protein [Rhizobium leguminosarum]NKK13654.1 hypothetical protein [Rhizobium leguminosarum bv. viciae]
MNSDLSMIARAMEMSNAPLPVAYERATQAIAECDRVDECKSWSDRAAALASYARQADDKTLENYAMRIRSRAIKRAGELLKEFDAKGQRTDLPKPSGGAPTKLTQREVAEAAGMSKDQQVTAIRVANVPTEDFERQVGSENPPTITQLAGQGKKVMPQPVRPAGFAEATKLIGELERFSAFLKDKTPEFILGGMDQFEIADARLTAVSVCEWLQLFIDQSRENVLAAGQRATQKPSKQQQQSDPAPSPPPPPSSGPIGPIDDCAMHLRDLVLRFARAIPAESWATLITELRDELADIERVLEQRRVSMGADHDGG